MPEPTNPNNTLSVAILSGKGGVGKTNLALNLSYALFRAKHRVLLMAKAFDRMAYDAGTLTRAEAAALTAAGAPVPPGFAVDGPEPTTTIVTVGGCAIGLLRFPDAPASREPMDEARIRHLPIIDENGAFVGLLTHRDMLAASVSRLAEIDDETQEEIYAGIPLKEVMRTDVAMASPELPLRQAAEILLTQKYGCLPVVAGGKLVGILTSSDFIRLSLELMAIASIVFEALWRRLGGFRAAKGDWPALLFMAFCEPCLYFVFEAWALTLTQASQAAMITAMLPVLTALTAAWVLKERLEAKSLAGSILAVVGVVIMSLTGEANEQAPHPVFGNLLEFVAMCCAVGYIVTAKRLAARHKPLYLTAVQSFTGTFFFTPALFFVPLPETIQGGPVFAVLFLGLGVTFVAYGLYNYGVSRVPATKAAAFINLIPVVACLLSRVFLDETLSPLQWAGGGMRRKAPSPAPRPSQPPAPRPVSPPGPKPAPPSAKPTGNASAARPTPRLPHKTPIPASTFTARKSSRTC